MLVGILSLAASCDNPQLAPQDGLTRPPSGEYPLACGDAPEAFRNRIDGIDHHAIVYVAELAADKRLSLNGAETSKSEMLGVVRKASRFLPTPYLILQIETSTPCAAVADMRSALVSTELCQQGSCAEGQDWREW